MMQKAEAEMGAAPREGAVEKLRKEVRLFVPPRQALVVVAVLLLGAIVLTDPASAQNTTATNSLTNTLQSIGDFVSAVVLGVAVPNGAYGFLQYMTAGSNVEQDEKGRKRIRNTFIAMAGVALIQVAVRAFGSFVGI